MVSPEETAKVNDHLIRCAACREEYEQLARTCGKIAAVSFVEPGDAEVVKLWKNPFVKTSWRAGLFLLIGGYLALIGYGIYEYMASGGEALFGKIAVAAIMIGALTLLLTVIHQRILTYRNDPYKEVER